jgi:basic membrane protein A
LISQGADVVTNHTDSTAVVQAAEEKGVWSLSYNSDMAKYGPKTCLTGVTMIWDQYYIDEAKAALDGSWKSKDTWGGLKEGMVKLAPFNKVLPDAVVKEVGEKQAAISAGTLKPFAGPIANQEGKQVVGQGTSLNDKDILEMKWFAAGVQGKV